MSTLLGVFARNGRPVEAAELTAMARLVVQQGPDGQRHWRAGCAALGILLLHEMPECVYDAQPAALDPRIAADPPADVVIIADCRIDNRAELAALLGIAPRLLPHLPDSQLILAAYLRWGADCPPRLLGDFAFAIWDGRTQALFCGRDPLGIKPFYYHLRDDLLLLSSDVRGVVAHPAAPRRADEQSLAHHLRDFAFIGHTATYLAEIVKLPPAHTLTVDRNQARVARYWFPEKIQPLQLPTPDDYVRQARALLEDAVMQRIRTAHPVGAHLSGGLDSSSVAVLAGRTLQARGQRLPTYNWQPTPGPDDDVTTLEFASLRLICASEGFTHTNVDLTPAVLVEQLQRDICFHHALDLWHEPLVRRAAACDGVRVLLSGWGGDELISFNGRGWQSELFWQGQWRTLWRRLWQGPTVVRRGRRLVGGLYRGVFQPMLPAAAYRLLYTRGEAQRYTGCATSAFAAAITPLPAPTLMRTQPTIHRTQLHLLQLGHLTQRAEVWANAGADDGMVYRFPLLDRRLVEFSLAAPSAFFFDGRMDRVLFRRAVEGVLPPTVQGGKVKDEPVRVQRLIAIMRAALEHILTKPGTDVYYGAQRIDVPRLKGLLKPDLASADLIVQEMQTIKSIQVLLAGAELRTLG